MDKNKIRNNMLKKRLDELLQKHNPRSTKPKQIAMGDEIKQIREELIFAEKGHQKESQTDKKIRLGYGKTFWVAEDEGKILRGGTLGKAWEIKKTGL